MKIVQKSRFFASLTAVIVAIALALFFTMGLRLGIDFTGGSLLELSFEDRPEVQEVEQLVVEKGIENPQIKTAGDSDYIIRMRDISPDTRRELLGSFEEKYEGVVEKRFENIGPTLGNELKNKAVVAISLVLVFIVGYLGYAFRKVSSHVASWKFGLAAIIALIHDIAIIIGVFVLLGNYAGVEVDTLFVTALLTVLGFSVHDTIVVFDRVRFNLLKKTRKPFVETVNKSVLETLARSINTSATTLFVLVSLYLFGGESIQWFVLALIIGVIAGTYSSIFVASPALVLMQKYKK